MSKNEVLKVDLGERGYDIVIGKNLLSTAGDYIRKVAPSNKYIIVTDNNIPESYAESIFSSLGGLVKCEVVVLPAGEELKDFAGLESLMDNLFALKPDRNTVLIALGGGVIGDLTGFAASILLRGVRFVQVPTTLLAQVDSSVGGKTGINNRYGKNLIGSFYQPQLVLVDIGTLKTLPEREFLAGYAEVVKYGLINDAEFFDYLDDHLDMVLQKDTDTLKYIISKSCSAKAGIVEKDEKEAGMRALLNLGHTFGHALEQQMGYDGRLVHGEAVAIGIVFVFMLSSALGLCNEGDLAKVKGHFERAGLPLSPLSISKEWDAEGLLEAMYQDKKASDKQLVFVLVEGIGHAFIQKGIDSNVILDTIGSIVN